MHCVPFRFGLGRIPAFNDGSTRFDSAGSVRGCFAANLPQGSSADSRQQSCEVIDAHRLREELTPVVFPGYQKDLGERIHR